LELVEPQLFSVTTCDIVIGFYIFGYHQPDTRLRTYYETTFFTARVCTGTGV